MIVPGLSIDPRGLWSTRQAEHVRRHLADELDARGLKLRQLDVSTPVQPNRAVLQVMCAKHDCVIQPDSACPICMSESSVRRGPIRRVS